MSQRDAFEILARMTGGLRPSKATTNTDLRTVRSLLVASLRAGVEPREQSDAERLLSTPLGAIDEGTAAELRAIVEAAIPETTEQERGFRLERRELPVAEASFSGVAPTASSGAAIARSFGPFLTADDRVIWFDLFRVAQFVSVVRGPGGAPVLFASVRDLIGTGTSYALDAGSVWMNAQLLAANAPAASYSGLRITGGRLELSSPATVAGLTIHAPASATMTLVVQLDAPAAPAGGTGPGADARALQVELPREVTFVFTPAGVEIRIPDELRLRLYGASIRLQRNAAPATYEPVVNRIFVPCDANRPTLPISDVRSTLFQPSGTAPIELAVWALPVAAVSPSSLTQAAGAGDLAVVTEPALRADWRGLNNGTATLGRTVFLAEPQRLTVAASSAQARRVTQVFDLWRDAASNTRHCALDLTYREPALLMFWSTAGEADVLVYSGQSVLHLDRPVRADGRRLQYGARTSVALIDDATGSFVIAVGLTQPPAISATLVRPQAPIPFALSNALLKVVPDGFILSGRMQGERLVRQGTIGLHFGVLFLLPTLPDPYAANVQNPREPGQGTARGQFTAAVQWPAPSAPTLSLYLSEEVSLDAVFAPVIPRNAADDRTIPIDGRRGEGRAIPEVDRQRLRRLREMSGRVAVDPRRDLLLLDVSTHADQFGVLIEQGDRRSRADAGTPPSLAIDGVSLATPLVNAWAFTVPAVQWEPVWTIQNPLLGHFPSPLGSPNDGSPFAIGLNTVGLVPIAPDPVVTRIVRDFRQGDESTLAAATFTLPFGMVAVAVPLRPPRVPAATGASLALVRPKFTQQNLAGGLQIALEALGPPRPPDSPSLSLPGAAMQLRNGIDPATHDPLNISVLGDTVPPATEEDVPNAVESIFNGEFAPGGANPRVPVTRIDFSGYGASTFSRWRNPKAEFAATSKVDFDVLVGRTGYEVVQVRSVLYPWGIRVVRTITIQRTGSGAAFRRDSGWVPVTGGLFDFPAHPTVAKIETHPGVVKAAVNVRRIRDTTHVYSRAYGSETVRLVAVRFDADIRIPGVRTGAAGGVVTSIDQLGFVQLAPSGRPLSPEEYADLIADQGPLGGPVDCVIDIGESRQLMRLTRVDVTSARTTGGQVQFVAAARGSLLLPASGQWSVVRTPTDVSKESTAVDRQSGLPLVRHGLAGLDDSVNTAPYKFSDPAFLLDANAATAHYGLLWSTGMQRVLFTRAKIDKGSHAITGDQKPYLADAYALISSTGIFPPAATSLEVPFANWTLDVPSEGHLKLSLPSPTFPAIRVTGGSQRDLSLAGGLRMYVDYTNTKFAVTIDSAAATSWAYKHEEIAVVTETNGITAKTTRGRIHADSGAAGVFIIEAEEFGKKFDKVKPILPMFATDDFSGSIPNGGAPSPLEANNKAEGRKVKFGLKREIEIPSEVPMLIGVTGEHGFIEIGTDFQNFFEIDLVVNCLIAHVAPVACRFKYEAEALKETLPGTSHETKVGVKEELQLAIGVVWGYGTPVFIGWFEAKAFIGFGFVSEHAPDESLVGVGSVYMVNGTFHYPNVLTNLASVGLTVEGVSVFTFEGSDLFLVMKGTIAVELSVALVFNIEFEIVDMEILKLQLL